MLMVLSVHVTSVLFLVLAGTSALTMGFYWSYTLLFQSPVLMHSCHQCIAHVTVSDLVCACTCIHIRHNALPRWSTMLFLPGEYNLFAGCYPYPTHWMLPLANSLDVTPSQLTGCYPQSTHWMLPTGCYLQQPILTATFIGLDQVAPSDQFSIGVLCLSNLTKITLESLTNCLTRDRDCQFVGKNY